MSQERRDHIFTVGGGHQINDGKCSHPNHIALRLRQTEALSFAMDILSKLQEARFFNPGEEYLPEIIIPGQLDIVSAEEQQYVADASRVAA